LGSHLYSDLLWGRLKIVQHIKVFQFFVSLTDFATKI